MGNSQPILDAVLKTSNDDHGLYYGRLNMNAAVSLNKVTAESRTSFALPVTRDCFLESTRQSPGAGPRAGRAFHLLALAR